MNSGMLNIIFVLLSCAVAHFIPFELMLGAYAFLGPAHYLTEISWLHDRNYFSARWVATLMVIGTVLVLIRPDLWGIYLWSSLAIAASAVFLKRRISQALFLLITVAFFYLTHLGLGTSGLILMVLLPTIIHVFIFTVLFILHGSLKRPSVESVITLVLLIIASLSFFYYPTEVHSWLPKWTEANIGNFTSISHGIEKLFGLNSNPKTFLAISQFVAFAYTFHYLNWFSKTKLVGWQNVSRKRLWTIIVSYLVFVGIYLYDYSTGLSVLFFLSVLHVILEFPLNLNTAQGIFQISVSKLRKLKSLT